MGHVAHYVSNARRATGEYLEQLFLSIKQLKTKHNQKQLVENTKLDKNRIDRVTLLCGDPSKVGSNFQLRDHVPQEIFGKNEMEEWDHSMQLQKEQYFSGQPETSFK